MEIRELNPSDRESLRAVVEIENAVRAVDSPWMHPLTEHEAFGQYTYGWDLEPARLFLATEGAAGSAVGWAALSTSERDNLHLAWIEPAVHPDHRRRGHGAAMLAALAGLAVDAGRTCLGVGVWEAAGAEAFALRHGFERKQVEVNRRQYLAEVDPSVLERLHAEAAARASDYELVRAPATTPEDQLEELAVMAAAINDAPTDELDYEDEVIDAARVRAYETAQRERGYLLHRLVARHRATGELAGQTVVVVDSERPHLAEQHDTSVVATHRGHRIGALLKTGMLQWLAQEQPQVTEIDTWNAESNDYMIGVNQALGYRVMGRAFALQKSLMAEAEHRPDRLRTAISRIRAEDADLIERLGDMPDSSHTT